MKVWRLTQCSFYSSTLLLFSAWTPEWFLSFFLMLFILGKIKYYTKALKQSILFQMIWQKSSNILSNHLHKHIGYEFKLYKKNTK